MSEPEPENLAASVSKVWKMLSMPYLSGLGMRLHGDIDARCSDFKLFVLLILLFSGTRVTQGAEDVVEGELEEAGLVAAPDGGWGWMIVAGSFLANVVVDGIIFTAGSAFQPEWEKFFGTSSSSTAWVVSLLSGCYLLVGPVASALANFFGCRMVAMAGTILAFIGFILSQFAQGLPLLYLTFGVMGGIGFGLIYLPSIVIVSYYFKTKRAFATGLAVCGSGIGTFVFAPLIKFLLDHYSWQQSVLIISGICLNGLICGALYRSLKPTKRQVQRVADIARKYRDLP